MSPTLTQFIAALATQFVGVVQSVVTPDAESVPFEGTVTPGWLVPCELSGSIAGTCYLAIATEDAAKLAGRILMKETVSQAEVGQALRELSTQAAAGLGSASPFNGLTVTVGKPVTSPVAPGAAAGGFACQLDESTTVRMGCTYAGGAASAVPGATASIPVATTPRHTGAAAGPDRAAPARIPGNLDLILDIDMPITVRFGEAVLTLEALSRLGPGSLVELSRQPEDPVEVLINGRLVARGEVVVVSGNYAVRVTEVSSAAERIRTINA